MGNERHRQRVSPIDVSVERSEHIGEQDERHPLENLRHQLVRNPDQHPDDEACIDWNPEERSNPGDQLCCLGHAAEISTDIDDIRNDENRAGSPEHPAWVVNPYCGCQPAPRNHAQPRAHELDRHHQWKRGQHDPQRGVPVGRPGGQSRPKIAKDLVRSPYLLLFSTSSVDIVSPSYPAEFSDGTVTLASLIPAASLRPKEQLLNHVTEGQKDIASGYLAFLSRFHDSARWVKETDKTEATATVDACFDQD